MIGPRIRFDAFRYLAMAWQEIARPQLSPPMKPIFLPMNELTFDDLEEIEQAERYGRL